MPIIGTSKGETLFGTDDADTIRSLGGNDVVFGGQGKDRIEGGAGNDELYGEEDNDTIFGGTGKDTISGGDGKDKLYGDSGDDKIIGGEGDDSMRGGAGSDKFVINEADGEDTIHDFVPGTDKLILAGLEGVEDFEQLEFDQKGPDTLLILGEDQGVRFSNTDVNDLSALDISFEELADNFIFMEPTNELDGPEIA
jgi:Ca2+-binding RTX toxin-like protein